MPIRRLTVLAWVSLVALTFLAGCGPAPIDEPLTSQLPGSTLGADPTEGVTSSGFDVDDLLAAFENVGLPLRVADSPDKSDLFGPDTEFKSLSVQEETIYLFAFTDERAAIKAAEGVSPDGSSITVDMGGGDTRSSMSYPWGPIHFYRRDAVIVLHMENVTRRDAGAFSKRVTEELQDVMGPKFAGQ
jgi:hypothetical protein